MKAIDFATERDEMVKRQIEAQTVCVVSSTISKHAFQRSKHQIDHRSS
ncbi:hypothetical protein Pla52o_29240 [Novipirellula galeiformis]|uniref:Uncharacterized protein n=1 Tax=Novipirellula galeiformis TaxID=2528004 RepID=A0A5C6CGE9_9BACT|nr:hypothetical protein Pla52o_29240 [Novipirellula galeiformis]